MALTEEVIEGESKMGVKVYYSEISAHKEVKKRQQKVMMILDSKLIPYEAIDITEAGKESQKDFVLTNAKPRGDNKYVLSPQIFNGEEYCGDYDDFELANEIDELEKFLKVAKVERNGVVNGNQNQNQNQNAAVNGSSREGSAEKQQQQEQQQEQEEQQDVPVEEPVVEESMQAEETAAASQSEEKHEEEQPAEPEVPPDEEGNEEEEPMSTSEPAPQPEAPSEDVEAPDEETSEKKEVVEEEEEPED